MRNREANVLVVMLTALLACTGKKTTTPAQLIDELNLKRGSVISCGSPSKEFGTVDFTMSCDERTKADFNLAVELLHSFEYDEAEKVFSRIIDVAPQCAMAYWGIAMSNFHPLWSPPTEAELEKGAKAIQIARAIEGKSARESGYIDAIGQYYSDWLKSGHQARCLKFEKAMEQLYASYPDDKEAAIFYALALDAAARPTDKTYANQRKAGEILEKLYLSMPNHPGIIHYIIHTYDYPGLAGKALPAARRYARVAPSSAHALHMPSHIFTRLGLWDECINSNLQSVSAAKCYAESAGINGHWAEELHGLDYLEYAFLQKGQDSLAAEQVRYLDTISNVYPVDFKVAYAFAAIPSRFLLENKRWKEAAALPLYPSWFPWDKFPWQQAIVHFARALGLARSGQMTAARNEWERLVQLRDTLLRQGDEYKANQVAIQAKAIEAWIDFESGEKDNGLKLMKLAADMEDSTEKHPVTPGEVLPARELLADMLDEARRNDEALAAYESVLKNDPNRFNSLQGAGIAAEKAGDMQKAGFYFKQLVLIADPVHCHRPELAAARSFLTRHDRLTAMSSRTN